MSGIPHPVKICHITHVDNLVSIVNDGYLWCDANRVRIYGNTSIGMTKIKKRRLEELTLSSYPELHVGDCVPFYFCPRSVMLFTFYRGNHNEIDYRGGQEPIIHLVADMHRTVCWAEENGLKWVFTSSNAGSYYFDDYTNEDDLDKINWDAVRAHDWRECREEKQAEFLIENKFPWNLIECIGVYSETQLRQVNAALNKSDYRPPVEVKRNWYY